MRGAPQYPLVTPNQGGGHLQPLLDRVQGAGLGGLWSCDLWGSLFTRVFNSPDPSRGRGCVALAATRARGASPGGAARGTGTRGGYCLSNAVLPLRRRRLCFGAKPQDFGPWRFPGCFSRCRPRWYPGATLHRSPAPFRQEAVGSLVAGNRLEDAAASGRFRCHRPRWPRDSGHQTPPSRGEPRSLLAARLRPGKDLSAAGFWGWVF